MPKTLELLCLFSGNYIFNRIRRFFPKDHSWDGTHSAYTYQPLVTNLWSDSNLFIVRIIEGNPYVNSITDTDFLCAALTLFYPKPILSVGWCFIIRFNAVFRTDSYHPAFSLTHEQHWQNH